jgi:hypothetical protein
VWQRLAGSFGIGLIAALFSQQSRAGFRTSLNRFAAYLAALSPGA